MSRKGGGLRILLVCHFDPPPGIINHFYGSYLFSFFAFVMLSFIQLSHRGLSIRCMLRVSECVCVFALFAGTTSHIGCVHLSRWVIGFSSVLRQWTQSTVWSSPCDFSWQAQRSGLIGKAGLYNESHLGCRRHVVSCLLPMQVCLFPLWGFIVIKPGMLSSMHLGTRS